MKFSGIINKPITYILLFTAVLFTIGITWGLPNVESWMSDSLAPYHPLLGLSKGFSFGYVNKYPLVHQIILAILNLPVVITAIIASKPLEGLQFFKFLVLLRSPSYATALMLIDNAVSIVMGVLIVYLMYLSVRKIYNERAALYSALILSFNVVLNFYSHTAKVDVPYVFWAMASLYFLIRIVKYDAARDYIYCAVFCCLSFGTKDQGYAIFILPFIIFLVLYQIYFRERQGNLVSIMLRRNMWIFAAAFIAGIIVVENLLFNYDGFLKRYALLTGDAGQRSIGYSLGVLGIVRLFADTALNIMLNVMGIPFFILSIVGVLMVIFLNKNDKRAMLLRLFFLFPLVSYYLFFVQMVRQSEVRFLLPLGIFFSAFGGYALDYIHEKYGTLHRKAFLTALALICVLAFYKTFSVNVNMLYDVRYVVEDWMDKNIPPGSKIEYYDYLHYLPRFPENVFAYRIKKGFFDIESRKPDFIIESVRVKPPDPDKKPGWGRIVSMRKQRKKNSEAEQFRTSLLSDKLNYRLYKEFRRRIPLFETINNPKISPIKIKLYKRIQ